MEHYSPDNWLNALLMPLPDEKIHLPISEDNALWLNIEDNIARLGSLAHGQIDIPEIRQQALNLLATESKDFRLVVHLLRTLQQGGNAPELLSAVRLLVQYVQHYWQQSWPENKTHKIRFAQQVIKRFEAAAESFASNASEAQRDSMSGELAFLAKLWRDNACPVLAESVDDLFTLYQRCMREQSQVSPSVSSPAISTKDSVQTVSSTSTAISQAIPAVTVIVENHDEKSWRETLLKVAGILCERQPDNPLGYRLRRQAIWQGITSAPQAEGDGRTMLAAFSADMMMDYQTRANHPDTALWQQVELSLTLAPYWFDGHALSALIAERLGFHRVADAIKDEAVHFLQRIPRLDALLFNDRTPFFTETAQRWLKPDTGKLPVLTLNPGDDTQLARQHLHEQGLDAALRYIETRPEGEPRDRFYRQYLVAQLLEEAGMVQLAQQHYRTLFSAGLRTALSDWEPTLLACLEEKLTTEQ
ncbi:type VI secretion system protein TssA [Lelliottia sp. WAP21]|uniref:type VI secretion system protein TssA n=1 Tax=Lelliottia sp. WAP21 TaxID=2877426 RepID=UPI001E48E79C|nr:type VI secretion system protein TssA [Lelliottia sp. WAP21]